MGFGWPLALLGLTALAVPLLIHLLQKGQSQRVEFASTRWLRSTPLRQRRRLRLEHPWLFLLRVLLLIAATLLLSLPYIEKELAGGAESIVLVSPRVDEAAARASLGADWTRATQRLWLAPGFPAMSAGTPPAAGASWSLVSQADSEMAPAVTLQVVAAADAARLPPIRPELSRRVEITLLPAAGLTPGSRQPSALYLVQDEAKSRAGRTAAQRFTDVLSVWQRAGVSIPTRAVTPTGLPDNARWIIWLGSTPPPGIGTSARTIVVTDEVAASYVADLERVAPGGAEDAPWLREVRKGKDRWLIANNSFVAGDIDLAVAAEALLEAMIGDAAHWPSLGHPVTAEQWSADAAGSLNVTSQRQPLTGLLAWLLAIIFVVERSASGRVAAVQADG